MDIQTESSSKTLMDSPKRGTRSTGRKCICLSVAAVILAIGLLLLILGLTVFKAKHPTTTVNSISLDDLDFSLDLSRLRLLLNVTLDVNVSVENRNRVGFKYESSTAVLRHRGNEIGEAPVPAGGIGARDTQSMNLTLSIMADRLLSDSSMFSDGVSGTLPFQTYIRISGKVRVVFNIRVVSTTTCDFDINLGNRSLSNMECHYKTKI